jgi:hypothetical protein
MRRLFWLPTLLTACASEPPPQPVAGRGLVTFERTPPEGAVTAPLPVWKLGDRFVFRRGGHVRIAMRVVEADATGYVLEEEDSGIKMRFTPELWELGQDSLLHPEVDIALDPYDARFSWPLWVGKRWTAHYVSRKAGRPQLPFLVVYHCDALEEVKVPAGRMQTYRIWRRLRPAAEGNFLEIVTLAWYSPELGTIVRRLENGVITELEECVRQ